MNGTTMHSILNGSSFPASVPSDKTFFQNLQRYVYGYIMLIICGAGVMGNILAFAVLSRKSMRSSNSATYLRCLAAVDACVLLLAILRYRSYYVLLEEASVIDMVLTFDPYVQVYVTPFFWVALGVSSFITLSLSIERYLAIRWPLTLKQRCTKSMVWVCIALIITAVFLVTFPHFLCYKLENAQFGNMSIVAIKLINTYLDARAYLHAYNNYILPIIWYMVPWVIVAVFNILLSIQVQKSSRIRVGIPNLVNLNRNLSVLIILIVGMYMVCHFPRCILAFYCLVNHCSASGMGQDVNTKTYYILVAAADTLNILNSCLNIVVYCMTGSRFRQEVKRLVLCRSCCRQSTVHPANQTLHVSLREVPATPMDDRKSLNMSYKDLQLVPSNLPSPSQSLSDLQPSSAKISSNLSLKDCYNVIHSSLVLSSNRFKSDLQVTGSSKRKLSVITQPRDVNNTYQNCGGESSGMACAAHPFATETLLPGIASDLQSPQSMSSQPSQPESPPSRVSETNAVAPSLEFKTAPTEDPEDTEAPNLSDTPESNNGALADIPKSNMSCLKTTAESRTSVLKISASDSIAHHKPAILVTSPDEKL
ncbi:hypothetical protein BaRGS_00026519 [Batillaria attramentaria]|uniref:G-protein coupled receptors family 1 profile domain-containing protein n=1 Tax=Batillaria attramentaria TaxID=370345 RepID=A0ABD0K5S0_9CAEN